MNIDDQKETGARVKFIKDRSAKSILENYILYMLGTINLTIPEGPIIIDFDQPPSIADLYYKVKPIIEDLLKKWRHGNQAWDYKVKVDSSLPDWDMLEVLAVHALTGKESRLCHFEKIKNYERN